MLNSHCAEGVGFYFCSPVENATRALSTHRGALFMTENWRPVVGYEGFYDVSDRGRVRSLPRRRRDGYILRGIIIKQRHNKKTDRHLRVDLHVDYRVKSVEVHRLVALSFIGLRPEGLEVNHKDSDPTNNDLGNLEYITHKENCRHAHINGHGGGRAPRPVIRNDGKKFESIKSAARDIGAHPSDIQWALKKDSHTCRGYQFK